MNPLPRELVLHPTQILTYQVIEKGSLLILGGGCGSVFPEGPDKFV